MARLSVSNRLVLESIQLLSTDIADLQDKVIGLRNNRDDLIREGLEDGMTKVQLARAADLSVEQVRNVEAFRYSRDSRRKQNRNPGPARD